jgi:hypothetical protein
MVDCNLRVVISLSFCGGERGGVASSVGTQARVPVEESNSPSCFYCENLSLYSI